MVSSALELELDIIERQYHPSTWNIYTFYCGDGENWFDDNIKAIDLLRQLKEINQLVVYTEINEKAQTLDEEDTIVDWQNPTFAAWNEGMPDSLWTLITQLLDDKFKRILLRDTNSIWKAFKRVFGAKN